MTCLVMPDPRSVAIPKGRLFIRGRWMDGETGERSDVIDPTTEAVTTTAACASEADVDRAVTAAREAFDDGPWPRMPGSERAKILHRVADLIEARADDLANRQARESGMRAVDFRTGIAPYAASLFRYFAGWTTKLEGRVLPVEGKLLISAES